MKKKSSVLFMITVLLLLSATTLLAGNVERGTDGSLRVKDVIYSPVDITVSKEALFHEMEWKKAVETPGVVVPLVTTEESLMFDFFHQKTITVAKTGIVFDEKSKVVEIVKGREVESKVVFNPSFIFWGVSLMAMAAANISFKKREEPFFTAAAATIAATATAATAATVVVVPVAFATTVVVVATTVVAFAAAFTAAVSSPAADSKKAYMVIVISAITYYVMMGVGAAVMMTSFS